jgi:hypothetical protein
MAYPTPPRASSSPRPQATGRQPGVDQLPAGLGEGPPGEVRHRAALRRVEGGVLLTGGADRTVDAAGGFLDVEESDPFQFPRSGLHGHHRLPLVSRPLLVSVLEPDGNPAGVTLEGPQWISRRECRGAAEQV